MGPKIDTVKAIGQYFSKLVIPIRSGKIDMLRSISDLYSFHWKVVTEVSLAPLQRANEPFRGLF